MVNNVMSILFDYPAEYCVKTMPEDKMVLLIEDIFIELVEQFLDMYFNNTVFSLSDYKLVNAINTSIDTHGIQKSPNDIVKELTHYIDFIIEQFDINIGDMIPCNPVMKYTTYPAISCNRMGVKLTILYL